jgi:hypothetical protein
VRKARFELAYPDCAGIAMGTHRTSQVAPHRDSQPVRRCGGYGQGSIRRPDWLARRGIRTVAREKHVRQGQALHMRHVPVV